MPARLRPLAAAEIADVLARLDRDRADGAAVSVADERAAVKHFLAVLTMRYPGKSLEVRVPPYAAVQCIDGPRHTRGTPSAVVETDARTWLALARGAEDFAASVRDGRTRASGERSDLSDRLPLV